MRTIINANNFLSTNLYQCKSQDGNEMDPHMMKISGYMVRRAKPKENLSH